MRWFGSIGIGLLRTFIRLALPYLGELLPIDAKRIRCSLRSSVRFLCSLPHICDIFTNTLFGHFLSLS